MNQILSITANQLWDPFAPLLHASFTPPAVEHARHTEKSRSAGLRLPIKEGRN